MKNSRQEKILELIAVQDIETQEQLLVALSQCGFYVTQATISRDIKQLRLVKRMSPSGVMRYEPSSLSGLPEFSSTIDNIFRQCVINCCSAQNLVVIKTLPGLASAACSAIDSMNLSVVVGTLAGDDTVLVIMRDNNAAAQFCGEISNLTN